MNSVATIGMESSNGITMADDLENTASGVITSLGKLCDIHESVDN